MYGRISKNHFDAPQFFTAAGWVFLRHGFASVWETCWEEAFHIVSVVLKAK